MFGNRKKVSNLESFDEKLAIMNLFRSVSVQVKRGSLVAVVGHVGSGKSSLLSALLGDMEKVAGHVKVQVRKLSFNFPYILLDFPPI